VARMQNMVRNGSAARLMILRTCSGVKNLASTFTPSSGNARSPIFIDEVKYPCFRAWFSSDESDTHLRRGRFKRTKKIEGAAMRDGAFQGWAYLMILTTIATDLPIVAAPALAVTLRVKEPGVALPGVEPPLEQPPMHSPTKIRPSAATVLCRRRRLLQPKGSSTPAKAKVEVAAHKRLSPPRLATALPVFIASMIVAGCTPSGVTVAGTKLQLTFAGKAPQDA
jgi:hypothetical protein